MVATRLAANNGLIARIALTVLKPFSISPEEGAETSVYLASSPEVDGISGKYFAAKKERRPSRAAQDDEAAQRLWDISAGLTKLATDGPA